MPELLEDAHAMRLNLVHQLLKTGNYAVIGN
jgi:hypothetical protein